MNELNRQRFKLSAEQVSSQVSDEVVILNHEQGIYYGMGQVGTTLWQALESGTRSFDELCLLIRAEYEVDQQTCETDVSALLQELIDKKLVEIDL